MGVYGSPYGIYGMNYNLGTSYQGKIGANGIAFLMVLQMDLYQIPWMET